MLQGLYNTDREVEQLVSFINIGTEQKTGSRIVVGLAGNLFKRLKQYYRDNFCIEPEDNQFMKCLVGGKDRRLIDMPFIEFGGINAGL